MTHNHGTAALIGAGAQVKLFEIVHPTLHQIFVAKVGDAPGAEAAFAGAAHIVSLDLDNQWSYMRTHGDAGWESFPTYLGSVLPLALETLAQKGLKATIFLVGRDALPHRDLLGEIPRHGHEVGNHSHNHLQWLHRLPRPELADEIVAAEDAITAATGVRPRGFRGPGFACSATLLQILAERGYAYDCSTFPTFVGPLARAYYFMTARKLTKQEQTERQDLFGDVRDGLRPLRVAGAMKVAEGVTTMDEVLRATPGWE